MSQFRCTPAARRTVRAIVFVGIAVTVVHYTDNVLRYERYTDDDPNLLTRLLPAPVIVTFGVVYVAVALWSLRRFDARERERTALGLAFFSTSGLVSLGHFSEISPSQLDAFQAVGIVADFLQGLAVLGVAIWVAWFAPPLVPTATLVGADRSPAGVG